MALLESVGEIAIGVAIEVFLFAVVASVVYRMFSGKFVIPKREVVLPNQAGVIVKDDRIVRIVGPGAWWIRPKQRLILCDMRSRPFRMVALEILGSDFGIVRISLSGSYKVSDPAAYYITSTSAADEIHIQLQRVVTTSGRELLSGTIINDNEAFAVLIRERLASSAAKLGLEITELKVWESIPVGFVRNEQTENGTTNDLPGGLIH